MKLIKISKMCFNTNISKLLFFLFKQMNVGIQNIVKTTRTLVNMILNVSSPYIDPYAI